jgi:hypothetical protein
MVIPLLPCPSPLRMEAPFQLNCSSGSESELLYVLATSPLRLTTSNFIFQLNTCGYSPYVTSSLTRGWSCRLQLLLVLARAFIIRSEFRGTHLHILLSQIRDSPQPGGPGPHIYIPQDHGPVITPGTGFELFLLELSSL